MSGPCEASTGLVAAVRTLHDATCAFVFKTVDATFVLIYLVVCFFEKIDKIILL